MIQKGQRYHPEQSQLDWGIPIHSPGYRTGHCSRRPWIYPDGEIQDCKIDSGNISFLLMIINPGLTLGLMGGHEEKIATLNSPDISSVQNAMISLFCCPERAFSCSDW